MDQMADMRTVVGAGYRIALALKDAEIASLRQQLTDAGISIKEPAPVDPSKVKTLTCIFEKEPPK